MVRVNDVIQLLLSSSRCTLPREKGNGSLRGYGPRGRVRVSTRSWSLGPVPVVPLPRGRAGEPTHWHKTGRYRVGPGSVPGRPRFDHPPCFWGDLDPGFSEL